MPLARKPDTRGLADYALNETDRKAAIEAVCDEMIFQRVTGAIRLPIRNRASRIVAAVYEALAEQELRDKPYEPFK